MFIRPGTIFAGLLAAGTLLAGTAQLGHQDHSVSKTTQPSPQLAKAVNDRCPIRSEEIDEETPMRQWRGHAIGFCCPGCDKKWDAKPDAEKDAFLAKYVKLAPPTPAVDLARRFQAARAAGDTAALDRLFLGGGRATVLQNGSDAGTWERYRESHLEPEFKAIGVTTWRTVTESEVSLGATTIVSQTVTLTLGEGSTKRELSAAVTLVVVNDDGTPKVAHMHWSSHEVAASKK
ncbi:MAG TPA: hypothetical protein VHN77_04545 [Phycisphaerales bacterium]|nr:hypothetical protein [Phycisphaerales bacterium]